MVKHKRPSDSNQLAHSVMQDVISISEKKPEKNPAAVALGRLGGLKGGKARAQKLSNAVASLGMRLCLGGSADQCNLVKRLISSTAMEPFATAVIKINGGKSGSWNRYL